MSDQIESAPPAPVIIDWSRPVRTVGMQQAVRIIEINLAMLKPVIGEVPLFAGTVTQWMYSGRFLSNGPGCSLDLENIPMEVTP